MHPLCEKVTIIRHNAGPDRLGPIAQHRLAGFKLPHGKFNPKLNTSAIGSRRSEHIQY
jgi:hypothetical protein